MNCQQLKRAMRAYEAMIANPNCPAAEKMLLRRGWHELQQQRLASCQAV